MPFTASDLATIDRAIVEGVAEVTFSDGRKIRYSSVQEKMAARAIIQAEVNGAAAVPVNRSTFAEFSRD